nr:tail fiber protein [uncultured Roseateles sp.]
MSDPFVAEIRMFAGNFAPKGWALCNGQLLPISQNTALFSLLGTYYGGDGKSTFGLPNLQGRFPLHQGQGPGLTPRDLGESGGAAAVTLLTTELPVHGHGMRAALSPTTGTPAPDVMLSPVNGGASIYKALSNPQAMAQQTLSPAGGNQPHNNRHPYLALTFIIALQGVFPPRG